MTEASSPTIPPEKRTFLWKFLQMFCYIVTVLLFDLKAYGKRNVPAEGGVLLLANHQSFLDPVLVSVKLDRASSFLARSTLWKGAFGWLITSLNAFPVKQGRGDLGAMKQSIAVLQAGRALLVFPEGARTKDGEMSELASGISLLVRRAKVPVVPVAIEGAFKAWPRTSAFFKPAKIRVMYGKPIDFTNRNADEIAPEVEKQIRILIASLRELQRQEEQALG